MQKTITRLEHPRNHHMVGDGFRVSQYIPGYGREMSNDTSPFLMLDYNAPWNVAPQTDGHRPGVGFHPHRGFETVTIVYSGEIEHQDTAGNGGVIGSDEVQWMTAGSGLLHNEFMTDSFSRAGGIQHVAQLWVNLPRTHKMTPPKYQALTRDMIPEVVFPSGVIRVIAWNLIFQDEMGVKYEQIGAAKTFSPVELYDIRFERWGEIVLSIPENFTTMVLVVEGEIWVWEKNLKNGDMVHLSQSGSEVYMISSGIATILVMAGKPFDEPIVAYGPFVMNTESEIHQAFEDFRSGKMG